MAGVICPLPEAGRVERLFERRRGAVVRNPTTRLLHDQRALFSKRLLIFDARFILASVAYRLTWVRSPFPPTWIEAHQ
jgi:hypothetical protein